MNKYFTKEYIKECDCEEIQEIRQEIFYGDWFFAKWIHSADKNKKLIRLSIRPKSNKHRKNRIWLPTGDQLDEEIIKICGKHKWDYQISHYCNGLILCWINPNCINYSADCHNPLLAKIKLLKELLK